MNHPFTLGRIYAALANATVQHSSFRGVSLDGGEEKAATTGKLESSHIYSIAFPWRTIWEDGSKMRSIIPALFQSVTAHPHHRKHHHALSPFHRQADTRRHALRMARTKRWREGRRKQGQRELKKNKMEVKRKVEGGSQRRGEIQRGGNGRKQKRLGREAEEDKRRNTPLRDASWSFYLSSLKLESKAIFQKRNTFSSVLRLLWTSMRNQK